MKGNVSISNLNRSMSHRDIMPIRVLDSIIQSEEQTYSKRVSLYNRGDQLMTSLIDANKVRAFV
jgi:hypothetical protein